MSSAARVASVTGVIKDSQKQGQPFVIIERDAKLTAEFEEDGHTHILMPMRHSKKI